MILRNEFVPGIIDSLSLFNLNRKSHKLFLACVLFSVSVFGLFEADYQTYDSSYSY